MFIIPSKYTSRFFISPWLRLRPHQLHIWQWYFSEIKQHPLFNTHSSTHSLIWWNSCSTHTLEMSPTEGFHQIRERVLKSEVLTLHFLIPLPSHNNCHICTFSMSQNNFDFRISIQHLFIFSHKYNFIYWISLDLTSPQITINKSVLVIFLNSIIIKWVYGRHNHQNDKKQRIIEKSK